MAARVAALARTAAAARTAASVGQNLFRRSQEFLTSPWTKNGGANVTLTADVETAPDGTLTADRVVVGTGGTNQGVYYDPGVHTPVAVGITACVSVWLKGAVGGEVVDIGDASSRTSCVLTTSWVRYVAPAHAQLSTFNVFYAALNTTPTYYIWGAQIVKASWAGPYVVTTASAVTTGLRDAATIARSAT